MNRNLISRVGALTSVALLSIITLAPTGPAHADEVIAADTSGTVVAGSQSVAAAAVPTAIANRPRTISVGRHGGQSVTLFAKGERIRRILAPGSRVAVFRGLTPGRTYTVAVGGQTIGAVIALSAPAAAAGLQVRTNGTPDSVSLTWKHHATTATGGKLIRYEVTATSKGVPTIRVTSVGRPQARLEGLDPDALYTFTVRPRNNAGTGGPTTARMSRPLSAITGAGTKAGAGGTQATVPTTPSAPEPAVPVTPPTPVTPPPSPAPAPAPAPAGPRTTTIWVCPDGFAESGGQCLTTKAYTFHEETQTLAYTYTWTKVGSHQEPSGGACNYLPDPSSPTGFHIECPPPITVDDYANVKDPTPTGFTDTGTAWVKTVTVKDPLPTGYLDDGTQWVKTTAKVAREITV